MSSSKALKFWGIVIAAAALTLAGSLVAAQGASLDVKVKYTGQGTVDESHAIHVFLFDTPNIQAGSMPIGYVRVNANGEAAKFSALTATPVYIAVAYDEAGGYDPNIVGAPPSGTPVAVYSTDATGAPSGIDLESGKENQVEIEFSDAVRMP